MALRGAPVIASLHRAALFLVSLLLCGASTVVCASFAAAVDVPTCRGVPATIVGTDGDDRLDGTDGNDVIFGGKGIDVILGGLGDDLICGGPSRYEEIDVEIVYQELLGGEGDDIVVGGSGDDFVFGDVGNDLLIANGGADQVAGGEGIDRLFGGWGDDLMNGYEGADELFGGPGRDYFEDFEGANLLDGGDGPDHLASGPGDETIVGGPGRDVVSYVETLDPDGSGSHCNDITADLSLGTAQGIGFGADLLQDIENVWTGGGSDNLVGDESPNGFYPGYPCSQQGSPVESVTGNGGLDLISFNSNEHEGSAPGPVRVDLAAHTARWRIEGSLPAVLLSLHSIENVMGTEYRDVILGDAEANTLSGGPYYSDGDVLMGRRGPDVLTGHGGNDLLYGGRGADELQGRGGADLLSGQRESDQLYGGRGADQLYGRRGADLLAGQRDDDLLYGGAAADELLGRLGDDRLDGGLGRNQNDGGLGFDTCLRPRQGDFAVNCER